MSLKKKPENDAANPRKRGRMIHLPSVGPDCYLEAHRLQLGKYRDCLSELSKAENWGDLRLILKPVVELVVKDALGQYFVDDVRRRFDSTMVSGANGDSRIYPFVSAVILSKKNEDVEVLKMLLSVGLDPDLSDAVFQARPSHWCGVLARADLAGLIFPCRPSMTVKCHRGQTPLQRATANHPGDKDHPGRGALRADVEKYIKTGGFETRFPTLPELALRKQWFAVKNLLRRQVVAESEFTEQVDGKTAADWAELYKETGVAKEINYYATALAARFEEAAKQMTAMAEELCNERDDASTLRWEVLGLRKELGDLKDEAVAKEATIEELSEAVSVFRARLEGAGISFYLGGSASSKHDAACVGSVVDEGCDVDSAPASSSSD